MTSSELSAMSPSELQQAARDHRRLHFTGMSAYADGEIPIIVRGDGCYLEDSNGKRYLDGLRGSLRSRSGTATARRWRGTGRDARAALHTNWTYAHPRAIELAAEVAALAPAT